MSYAASTKIGRIRFPPASNEYLIASTKFRACLLPSKDKLSSSALSTRNLRSARYLKSQLGGVHAGKVGGGDRTAPVLGMLEVVEGVVDTDGNGTDSAAGASARTRALRRIRRGCNEFVLRVGVGNGLKDGANAHPADEREKFILKRNYEMDKMRFCSKNPKM